MAGQMGKSKIEELIEYMEKDVYGAQVVIYGLSGIGLITAVYRIRPISKFTRPSQIPDRFIKSRVPLRGTVKGIEPFGGPFIMVDHKPLINIPRLRQQDCLPIKLANVDVTNNGISWLKTVIGGKEITFIPLSKRKNYVDCIITMPEKNKLQIAKELVKVGFGTVHKKNDLIMTENVLEYYKSLVAAQKLAQRRRNGEWQQKLPPTLLWKLYIITEEKLRSLLPSFAIKMLNI
ncbi:uncharacterized protein LOC105695228 isoform X2 [Orussus abietinus]|uniref:uncharacterized protein LOC105695228 isoform X2 n=1 Tax=Orussus abietinus TaxID=222816 RepID=UPI0006252096|nr:uncharacterized protein LOC105695228 isoform X2 [Orussus abietinus]